MKPVALVVLGCLLFTPPLLAENETLNRFVFGQGGSRLTEGSTQLFFTVGQPAVGEAGQTDLQSQFGYWWWLTTVSGVSDDTEPLPIAYALRQSAPNPFRNHTIIAYDIPAGATGPMILRIFDARGTLVTTLVYES